MAIDIEFLGLSGIFGADATRQIQWKAFLKQVRVGATLYKPQNARSNRNPIAPLD
jgi:hypothetical protein